MKVWSNTKASTKVIAAIALVVVVAVVAVVVVVNMDSGNGVARAEKKYAAHGYNGKETPNSVLFIDNTKTSDLLIVAPHAVNHHRHGQPKVADMYTGGIAEKVAEKTGASVLTTTGEVSDWGDRWGNRDDQFSQILRDLPKNVRVVDLHGMTDDHDLKASIGTGPDPDKDTKAWATAISHSLGDDAKKNGATFDATAAYTDTSFLQKRGHVALQLELSLSERKSDTVVDDVSNAITQRG